MYNLEPLMYNLTIENGGVLEMITVSEKQPNGLPVLEVIDENLMNDKLPLIIFYHGWTNCKEVVLTQGYELAKKGYRVLLPEALYHGVRAEGEVREHVLSFWEIIFKSVTEFPQLVDFYQKKDLIKDDQIGVGGFSMGGITTCMLMAAYPQITGGVVISGTPHPVEFAQTLLQALPADDRLTPEFIDQQLSGVAAYDLTLHPEKLAGRPLHFWHGDADDQVPCEMTQEFCAAAPKQVETQKVSLHLSAGAQHKLSYAVTEEMVQNFQQYLK